jgi:hypothetical protein
VTTVEEHPLLLQLLLFSLQHSKESISWTNSVVVVAVGVGAEDDAFGAMVVAVDRVGVVVDVVVVVGPNLVCFVRKAAEEMWGHPEVDQVVVVTMHPLIESALRLKLFLLLILILLLATIMMTTLLNESPYS